MCDRWDSRLTEARNPRTAGIDRASSARIVELIQSEDRGVPDAVAEQAAAIATLIDRVAARLCRGGRLFYVGAGTSGRLGVLDAAECPPTFGSDPRLVQGIIAGGREALVASREGAEDDEAAGRGDIAEAEVAEADFVLGIATSGTTPYVHAALEAAAERGAGIGFLSCTEPPGRVRELAEVLVTPLVGPEVIAGSTRMKAGTATKLVLNTLTTGVMVRLGRVYENLMIDLRAVSEKLVDRSLRILEHVCSVDRARGRSLLLASGGSVKTAIAMEKCGLDRAMAERLLDAADGFLGELLDRFPVGAPILFYAAYPPSGDPDEIGRLLGRLREAPERLRLALTRSEARAAEGRGSSGGRWTPADHLAHLVEFETGAIGPRVREILAVDRPFFTDWTPSDPPPLSGRTAEELIDRLQTERERTLDALLPIDATRFERSGVLGEEEFTLYQLLRGIAQHDEAHATRIEERLHPALLDTDPSPPEVG